MGEDENTETHAHLDGVADSDLIVEQALSMGGSYVLDALWRRLELDQTLRELLAERSFSIEIERLLFALVANRALAPRSKLAVERWAGTKVHIEGLDGVQSHALYRAMDFLVEHGEEIQKTVFFSVANLLNLEVDLLFFDTTSTYFELDEVAEDVALGYKQLLEVERAFRTMKNTLDLRPLHHRLPERIHAHVLLCWLGLLLVRVAENESGMTWDRIRDALEEISLVKLCHKDGHVEMVTNINDEQRNILNLLGIKQPKRVKILVTATQNL